MESFITVQQVKSRVSIGLSMDNINTKYKDKITLFVFNTVLHHVGISCIIKSNKIYGIWYGQTYHILIIYVFQLSIKYQHGVTFYSTQTRWLDIGMWYPKYLHLTFLFFAITTPYSNFYSCIFYLIFPRIIPKFNLKHWKQIQWWR